MLTDKEKSEMMYKLMEMGKPMFLGFIELHQIVALILNDVITTEEDLKIVFNNATIDLR
jgi:hypothetical protein